MEGGLLSEYWGSVVGVARVEWSVSWVMLSSRESRNRTMMQLNRRSLVHDVMNSLLSGFNGRQQGFWHSGSLS